MEVTFPERYHKAVEYIEKTYGDLESSTQLDNMQKLVFYALRQQTDVGPCTEAAPSMWYMKERYKHDAWKQLKTMSKFEAMVHYVQHLDEIKTGWINEVLSDTVKVSTAPGAVTGEDSDLEPLREPTPQNIEALMVEVFRLRQLLRSHNIPYHQPISAVTSPCADVTSSPAFGADASNAITASDTPILSSSNTSVPVPVKPVPASYADVVPPTKPINGAPHVQPTASVPLYYTPRKLTWMEWLGLVSVDEVVEKE